MLNKFTLPSHEHNTRYRARGSLFQERTNLKLGNRSFTHRALIIWNSLAPELKDSSYTSFVKVYQEWLLKEQESVKEWVV